jgi:small GTP-binding protein
MSEISSGLSYNLKTILLGDGYVGKTSLRRRFMGHQFSAQYLETLGADFAIKKGEYNGVPFRYQIWDLAGQPRFDSLRRGFFTGSQAALICFDISNPSSAKNLEKWVDEFWKFNGRGKIPLVIIGNKIDLRETVEDSVSYEEGLKVTGEISAPFEVTYVETSAKTGENVNKAFEELTRAFVEFNKIDI